MGDMEKTKLGMNLPGRASRSRGRFVVMDISCSQTVVVMSGTRFDVGIVTDRGGSTYIRRCGRQ